MKAYQDRVIEEKRDLDEKLEKLREFILKDPVVKAEEMGEYDLLHQQLQAMSRYSRILGERIRLHQSDKD